ncbi:MAG: flagellar biosynthesis protein FlhB [Gemmobacter sp.]
MSEDNTTEKEFEPTERRLQEARQKGEIARSPDISAAAGYLGLLLAMVAFGPGIAEGLGTAGAVLLSQADRLAPSLARQGTAEVGGILGTVLISAAPLFLLPMVAVLLSLTAQRAIVFAPSKLSPKLNRISPLQGLKSKFGRKGLFEFAKSLTKLILVTAILTLFLRTEAGRIVAAVAFDPGIVATELMRQLNTFLMLVCVMAGVIGALDFFWQRAEHLRSQRMTRKEMLDEMKSSEGDPHVKAQRRQRGQEIATNRMLLDVAKADVVIVNPTHYAVALRWDRSSRRAPVCVAKGVDEVAARIRARAAEAGVPMHRDPPTARMLHATVEIGAEIRTDQYRAVAAAIRFAQAMRRRKLWQRGARA